MTKNAAQDTNGRKDPPSRMTLWILISVVLGIVWGLFFGEYGAWIGWIGDAFVGLLQMTVLPYVAISLIANIGRLSTGQSGRLARAAISVLVSLWIVGLVSLLVLQFSFPEWEGGSFFSTNLTAERESMNWMDWFIPSNLFAALSNNFVPAVVLFSILFGVSLINVSGKENLLANLDVMTSGLSRLNKLVVRLSPLGIFGVVAHAASTISLEQFQLLQGYLLVYGAATAIMAFWILPMMIVSCTPLTYREVLSESRNVLITAFIIGNTFVVLPMIMDAVERLMSRCKERDGGPDSDGEFPPGYTVQLAYPFPDVGRLIALVFIPFAAWFYGNSIENDVVLPLIGSGLVGSFAKLVVTIPMLLDMAEIPTDIFNLFLAVGVLAGRCGDLMKSMHLLAFSILTASWLAGTFRFRWSRAAGRLVVTAAMMAMTVIGIRFYLESTFQNDYRRQDLVVARTLLSNPVPSVVFNDASPNPTPLLDDEDPLERIRRRGLVRIGFDQDEVPFSYFNRNGDLVGMDIDFAHQLARDLEVELEFIPFDGDVSAALKSDHFDIAMAGLEGTLKRASTLPQMQPYMSVTRAMVVPDRLRTRFKTIRSMKKHLAEVKQLRVGYIAGSLAEENLVNPDNRLGLGKAASAAELEGLFPYLDLIRLQNETEFFESDAADVLVTSAEKGSAWTLKHPQFAVVRPEGFDAETPLYHYVATPSHLREFINSWQVLKELNGTNQQLYDYWILGLPNEDKGNRWSVIADVLQWVD